VTNLAVPLRTVALGYDAGDDLEAMAAYFDLGADAVGFDLEDHVPQPNLPKARENIRTILDRFGSEKKIFVRPNEMGTIEFGDDLEAVVCAGLHSVHLAKTSGPEDVAALDTLLGFFERRAGLEIGRTLITPFLESARSTRDAYEIARASRRVAYMGGLATRNGDPAISIGYKWTPEMYETVYIRQKVLLDARAAGVPYPLGGLWNPFDDLEGLEAFAVQTRAIGYDGMAVLPFADQVAIVNRVFTPTQEEVEYWAEAIPLIETAGTDVLFRGEELPPNKATWGRRRLELAGHFGLVPDGPQASDDVS
jgi:citrate lyase subunit beta / citryl-CoA lyase